MRIGQWIVDLCIAVLLLCNGNALSCGLPDLPEGGYFSPVQNEYAEQESVMYWCNSGYMLQISDERQKFNWCKNGKWTIATPPKCVKEFICGKPGTPANGQRYFSQEKAHYYCKEGYILHGNDIRTCDSELETWTPHEMPKCVNGSRYIVGNDGHYDVSTLEFNLWINLGAMTDFTDILIKFASINLNLLAINMLSSNESSLENYDNFLVSAEDLNQSSKYSLIMRDGEGRTKIETANYIFIQLMFEEDNDFILEEIITYNRLESTSCGIPDEPLNSFITPSHDKNMYTYGCDYDFTLIGNSKTHCVNEQWSPKAPKCKENDKKREKEDMLKKTSTITAKISATIQSYCNLTITVTIAATVHITIEISIEIKKLCSCKKRRKSKKKSEHELNNLGKKEKKSKEDEVNNKISEMADLLENVNLEADIF